MFTKCKSTCMVLEENVSIVHTSLSLTKGHRTCGKL
nr:MAG TPA: hypothetical protein [Caudoviricetes sp.]